MILSCFMIFRYILHATLFRSLSSCGIKQLQKQNPNLQHLKSNITWTSSFLEKYYKSSANLRKFNLKYNS